MLNFDSGTSKSVNTVKAVRECLERALGGRASEANLVILNSTLGHKFEQMLATAREVCPEAEIVGCTGSGVIGTGWVSEAMRAMAAMAITGDNFTVVSRPGVTAQTSEDVARDCAEELATKNGDVNMVLVMGPGLNVNGDGVIQGIESVLGADIPLFGALGGFGGSLPRTPVFHTDKIFDDGLVLVGLSDPSLALAQKAHHGCLAQDDYRFTVTKSDGVRIDELDGEPAWPRFIGSLGMPPETSPMDIILLLGIGVDLPEDAAAEYDNKQILRAPLSLSEDGQSMFLQTVVPIGTELVSCQRNEDYLFSGSDHLAQRVLDEMRGRTPVAVFQADCMARGRLGHDVVDKTEIIDKLQGSFPNDGQIPWLGVYGFAEFCTLNGKNRFHNYTTSLSVILRDNK
jgi:hypothetical protein